MKILITGANGCLGTSLLKVIDNKFDVYASDLSDPIIPIKGINYLHLDITDKNQVEKTLDMIKPDIIIHAAALTDLEKCEADNALANKINVKGTGNIVSACKKKSIKLIFLSTDNVFDGSKGNYKETDETCPVNYYGETKVMAENKVKEVKNHLILRTTFFTFGRGFEQWLIDSLRNRKEVNVVDDQYYSPLFVGDFSRIIIEMIEKGLTGTFNVSLGRKISRYEFAIKLANVFNLDNGLIKNVSTEQLYKIITPKKYKIPKDVSLDNSKLKKAGIKIPSLEVCLNHMKEAERCF